MNWQELINLSQEKNRRYPMYARIRDAVIKAVETGHLRPGDKLLPDRELAELLAIDRSTVARAYHELESQGVASGHVGRGTFIASTPVASQPGLSSPVSEDRAIGGQAFPSSSSSSSPSLNRYSSSYESLEGEPSGSLLWRQKFSHYSREVSAITAKQPLLPNNPRTISFGGGVPSLEFFPEQEFAGLLAELSQRMRAQMFAYSAPEGHEELKGEIARLLSRQNIAASPEQILITNGSQQAIDLVARTLIDPGDVVVVEDPSYFWAICNFSAFGARILPVPVGAQGMDLNILETILSRQRVKFIYSMPTFQNPTGATLSLEGRKDLLELALRYQVPIIEDNFAADLFYESAPPPPLVSLDQSGELVIYQGTVSKALCPGLRIGWLLLPQAARLSFAVAKRSSDLSTNTLSQLLLAEFLQKGSYEKHLAVVRAAYKTRRDHMVSCLQTMLPADIQWSAPVGGMFLWLALASGYSSSRLLSMAEQEGVSFAPGELFFLGQEASNFFRLSFVNQNQEQISAGIERLAVAVERFFLSEKKRSKHMIPSDIAGAGAFI